MFNTALNCGGRSLVGNNPHDPLPEELVKTGAGRWVYRRGVKMQTEARVEARCIPSWISEE